MLIRAFPRPLRLALSCVLLSWLAGVAFAETTSTVPAALTETTPETAPTAAEITLELIMSDPSWIGRTPQNPYWGADSKSFYFEQERKGEIDRDLVAVDLEGKSELVEDRFRGVVDVAGGDWNSDHSIKIYSQQGDIFLRSPGTGRLLQLTRTVEREWGPQFMVGDQKVWFRRGQEIFIRHLKSGLEEQPVSLIFEDDPKDEPEPADYLSRQQPRLLEFVRRQQEKEELHEKVEDARIEADRTRARAPWYLGKDSSLVAASLSPRGDALLLVLAAAEPDQGRQDHMPSFVSEDGYVEIRDVRPKVGTAKNPGHRVVLLDLAGRQRHDLDLSTLPGISDDPLAELKELAAARQKEASSADSESEDATSAEGGLEDGAKETARPIEVETMHWSPDGSRLVMALHSYDNKDRWLATTSLESPSVEAFHRLSIPEGWINWSFNEFDWLPDSEQLYFLSEESGWSQLYLHSFSSGETQRLTQSDAVVSDPQLDAAGRHIYFTANPEHPGIYDTYRVSLDDKTVEKITHLGGMTNYQLSPNGQYLLLEHSTTTHPPELYLQPATAGSEAKRITNTVSEQFLALDWQAPEILAVPSSHQERPIYSRFYSARNTERLRDGEDLRPAVVFVHGAGYLQNAHHGWSGYFREFMFHTFLSQQGYTVLDMDYRASKGYGVDWRTAIYRQMGTPELEDLTDGVDWLVQNHGIDQQRVGVYGGSYGGFLTMMALFKQPDLFACGAALRPVTDWAHYNHPYTSNILNTPDVDPQAYEQSSPIEFAEGLSKPLLMCAPMLDDNVFFQDTVRLAQKLIELEKVDWEVAIFPIEPHGFREPSSWLNEYRRIFSLFEENLQP